MHGSRYLEACLVAAGSKAVPSDNRLYLRGIDEDVAGRGFRLRDLRSHFRTSRRLNDALCWDRRRLACKSRKSRYWEFAGEPPAVPIKTSRTHGLFACPTHRWIAPFS